MRESYIEGRVLGDGVKAAGGLSIKLAPIVAGLPDRLVLLPGGRLFFVETKAPGGRLRPVQRVMHARLGGLGFPVVVLSSPEGVRAWLSSVV